MFFEYGENADPNIRLEERRAMQEDVLNNNYDIRQDLEIIPTEKTARLMRGLRMVSKSFPWGYVVGIEVDQRSEDSGATLFFPKQEIDDSETWQFLLKVRSSSLLNITNHSLRSSLPGYYYFTNIEAEEGGKQFPSLSVELPKFTSDKSWEMGSVIQHEDEVLAASQTTRVLSDFIPIASLDSSSDQNVWHHWAHTGDRKLLRPVFSYRFDSKFNRENPIRSSAFILSTLDGNELKRIEKLYSDSRPAPSSVQLDFRRLPIPDGASESEKLAPPSLLNGWYNLQVLVNGEVEEEYRVLIMVDLPPGVPLLGMVEVGAGVTAEPFRVLRADGALNLTVIEGSNPVRYQPPVFEVRLMNRLSYWKYSLNELPDVPLLDINYTYSGNTFTSRIPRRLAQMRVPASIDVDGVSIKLPNPDRASIQYDSENGQYFSELFLRTLKSA